MVILVVVLDAAAASIRGIFFNAEAAMIKNKKRGAVEVVVVILMVVVRVQEEGDLKNSIRQDAWNERSILAFQVLKKNTLKVPFIHRTSRQITRFSVLRS